MAKKKEAGKKADKKGGGLFGLIKGLFKLTLLAAVGAAVVKILREQE